MSCTHSVSIFLCSGDKIRAGIGTIVGWLSACAWKPACLHGKHASSTDSFHGFEQANYPLRIPVVLFVRRGLFGGYKELIRIRVLRLKGAITKCSMNIIIHNLPPSFVSNASVIRTSVFIYTPSPHPASIHLFNKHFWVLTSAWHWAGFQWHRKNEDMDPVLIIKFMRQCVCVCGVCASSCMYMRACKGVLQLNMELYPRMMNVLEGEAHGSLGSWRVGPNVVSESQDRLANRSGIKVECDLAKLRVVGQVYFVTH